MSSTGLLIAFDTGVAAAIAAFAFGRWTGRRRNRR